VGPGHPRQPHRRCAHASRGVRRKTRTPERQAVAFTPFRSARRFRARSSVSRGFRPLTEGSPSGTGFDQAVWGSAVQDGETPLWCAQRGVSPKRRITGPKASARSTCRSERASATRSPPP
jgi:hypothetical protein